MLRISMVTPVFNAASTIELTIDSVRRQGKLCDEYIVVDSLSTDGTQAIVEANRDTVTNYIREKDTGIYDAMNKGIAASSGNVVGIINADDLLNADALRDVAHAFQDPDVDFVYSDADLVRPNGQPYATMRARPDWVAGHLDLLGRDWRFIVPFPHQSLFVRKVIYDQLGMFDCSFRLAADHEFMARLIASKKRGKYLQRSLATYVLGGAASNSTSLFAEDERIAVRYGMGRALARFNRVRSSLGRMKATALGRY